MMSIENIIEYIRESLNAGNDLASKVSGKTISIWFPDDVIIWDVVLRKDADGESVIVVISDVDSPEEKDTIPLKDLDIEPANEIFEYIYE